MATTRLRKTFHYPAENSDDDDTALVMDEEEQEKFIQKLRREDEERNEKFKRFFLAIPTIAAAAFIPALLVSRLFQVKLVCLVSMTSLIATTYILNFVPNIKHHNDDSCLSKRGGSATSKLSPIERYLSFLNGGLSLLLNLNAYSLKGNQGVHEGFWLLCFLPVVVFSISMLARRLMLSVDVGELEKLKYGYKGA